MTVLALLSERRTVNVIPGVAIDTGSTRGQRVRQGCHMAGSTPELAMGTAQLKVCQRVVIKIPVMPGPRAVTGVTFGEENALVMAIGSVALITLRQFQFKVLGFVARKAGKNSVQTGEREKTEVMIEAGLPPGRFDPVAPIALRPELSPMHVVSTMTVLAFQSVGVGRGVSWRVAGDAGQVFVPAQDRKRCCAIVVETDLGPVRVVVTSLAGVSVCASMDVEGVMANLAGCPLMRGFGQGAMQVL